MTPTSAVLDAPPHDSTLARAVQELCLVGHRPPGPEVRQALPSRAEWRALLATGSALWLDSGDAEAVRKLWTRELTALTTNNTLLNKEVQKGIYDDLVKRAAAALRQHDLRLSPAALVAEIAFVLNAAHGLKLVRTFDADVSVELHTDLSRDVEGGYRYGKRFHAVSPDRFIVKVPLTPEGLFTARRLVRDGIRVNFTLGFSARQNALIARVAEPHYVNVFMGRLNSFVSENKLGDGLNVGEKATLASQRLIRRFNQGRARAVRQIGASIRGGGQVRDLAGVDVLTIPTAAAEEFLALKVPPDKVKDRTGEDPPVRFREGLDAERERLHAFWDAGGSLPGALEALAREDLDRLGPQGLLRFLEAHGLGDLFPGLSREDHAQLATDGKIPVHSRWKERVARGQASWDGLMTESALESFAGDQKKLDDRIRGLL